ncbi:hypothetical protein LP419_38855 [Massilia sp. H-1]|nr:hypothetical protein LP419_38855 [Massilia sp. H-1]
MLVSAGALATGAVAGTGPELELHGELGVQRAYASGSFGTGAGPAGRRPVRPDPDRALFGQDRLALARGRLSGAGPPAQRRAA